MIQCSAVLIAILAVAVAVTTEAQTLDGNLNRVVLFADRVDRAIEKGEVKVNVVLYESGEDDDDIFSEHTTVSLAVTTDRFVRLQTLQASGSHYEVKELFFNQKLVPIVLIDENKQTYKRCFVFENYEPVIFGEAKWSESRFQFSRYKVQRVTPKDYQYAEDIRLEYEKMLKQWLEINQSKIK